MIWQRRELSVALSCLETSCTCCTTWVPEVFSLFLISLNRLVNLWLGFLFLQVLGVHNGLLIYCATLCWIFARDSELILNPAYYSSSQLSKEAISATLWRPWRVDHLRVIWVFLSHIRVTCVFQPRLDVICTKSSYQTRWKTWCQINVFLNLVLCVWSIRKIWILTFDFNLKHWLLKSVLNLRRFVCVSPVTSLRLLARLCQLLPTCTEHAKSAPKPGTRLILIRLNFLAVMADVQ